ncbi:hypothetical protein Pmar_PMAR023495, partial [Perkinsus marinus ATCC 50983]
PVSFLSSMATKSEPRDEDSFRDPTPSPSPPPSIVDTDQSLFEGDRFRPARLFPIGLTVDDPVKAGLACRQTKPRWRRRPVLQANGLTTYHWEKIPEVEQEANAQNPEVRENAGATAELPVKKAKPFMGEEGLMPDVLDQKIWVKIKEDVEKRFKCTCTHRTTTTKPLFTQEECQYLLEAAK